MAKLIELRNVYKIYSEGLESEVRALDGVSLEVERGEFVAVVGRSGGGKSTLLRLLAGLEKPNAGELLAGATPLAAIQDDTRMMFQDARLLPWKTVIDNVGLGLKGAWRDAALQALASVGLESRAQEWPAALSGGQKQRVALARALIHRPRLLLLDEPFSALDFLTRISMQEWLLGQWEKHKKTILFITHDVEEAVFLSGSVLAVTHTPIHRLEEIPVPADYPRTRECLARPEVIGLREQLVQALRKQVKE